MQTSRSSLDGKYAYLDPRSYRASQIPSDHRLGDGMGFLPASSGVCIYQRGDARECRQRYQKDHQKDATQVVSLQDDRSRNRCLGRRS